jgi:hypothetical protein
MEKQFQIEYLKNEEINFMKWDNCINNSHNGNIYAFSWYLDIVCEDWEALIESDYESVMPILPASKAGLKFTFTTYLANQLGVFSTEILDEAKVNAFTKKLQEIYPNFFINLNKFNNIAKELFSQVLIPTYEFDLIGDYNRIRTNYSQDNLRDLTDAENHNISIIRGMLPNDFLQFIAQKHIVTSANLKTRDIRKLRKIIAFVMQHGLGEIYSAYGPNNTLEAAVLFLKSNRKINLLFTAITREGLNMKAMHKVVDQYISKHAGENLTLNFENLAVPDRKAFCQGFGSKEYHYTHLRNPEIPWYDKLLIKFLT